VVVLSDAVVGRVYPFPSGLELSNAETARAAIAAVPMAALILLVGAGRWPVGSVPLSRSVSHRCTGWRLG
jgi:hypothetical protein